MKITTSILSVALLSVFAIACTPKTENKIAEKPKTETTNGANKQFGYAKGEQVPNKLVCMVNNAFMGKDQLEVPVNGKMYYGCCEMCKEKLPKDEKSRFGTDPQTGEKVDKADAYIVLVGDNGEVAYFANQTNYQDFLKENPKL